MTSPEKVKRFVEISRLVREVTAQFKATREVRFLQLQIDLMEEARRMLPGNNVDTKYLPQEVQDELRARRLQADESRRLQAAEDAVAQKEDKRWAKKNWAKNLIRVVGEHDPMRMPR